MKKTKSVIIRGILYFISLVVIVLVVIIAFSGDDQTNPTAEAYLHKQIALRTPIGETLVTPFFEITVTDANHLDTTENKQIVLDVIIKNIDTLKRTIGYGELLVTEGRKTQTFDQAVLIENPSKEKDQGPLLPGRTRKLKISYSIPASLKGMLYWHPAAADSNQTIELGDL